MQVIFTVFQDFIWKEVLLKTYIRDWDSMKRSQAFAVLPEMDRRGTDLMSPTKRCLSGLEVKIKE